MKTKKITLTNDFHKTSVTLTAKVISGDVLKLSCAQVRKARTALCGRPLCACKCVYFTGTRGEQMYDIDPQFDRGAKLYRRYFRNRKSGIVEPMDEMTFFATESYEEVVRDGNGVFIPRN